MKIYTYLYTIILIFFKITELSCNEIKITIFIHGTRGLSRLFLRNPKENNKIVNIRNISSSCLTNLLATTLSEIDPLDFSKENFYIFGWSGKLNNSARKQAAKILNSEIYKLINNLKKENFIPNISLITHSHGGNVALNLVHSISEDLKFQIDRLILLACPVQEQTSNFINHPMFKKVYSLYSKVDLMQVLDPQGFHQVNKNKKVPYFSQREFKPCEKLKQARIRINNHGLCHTEFVTTKFFQHLPLLLTKLDELPLNSVQSLVNV